MTRPRILFVDDESNVLSALRRSLRREEYSTLFAEAPEEALALLDKEKIDVVVSDYMMPSMNGLVFLNRIKALYPGVVRILLTGQADLQMAIQAINEGEVFRFLTKPWNDAELKITLRHILDFIELRRENQLLQDAVHKQRTLIERMEEEHPGIFKVKRDQTGAIVLDELDI